MRVAKLISGGQTGVDRAALEAAPLLGLVRGGWCPRGRRAEDGTIPPEYPLTETPEADYAQRTAWNVRDSDATLVLNVGPVEGGTAKTVELARQMDKPCRVVDLGSDRPDETAQWIRETDIAVLNVAGPRESNRPGIQEQAKRFLLQVLEGE